MEQMSSPSKRKFYYGWVIVSLSIISMSFWFGYRTSFSIFFVSLINQFHWGRAETAGVQSIAMIVYMMMAPVIGTLVNRIGPRRVILPGIILTALGLLLCTQIQTLFQFYLFFGVIGGIGVTCLSITSFTVILAHWFERKRGMANGLAAIGIGLGPLFFAPFIQYLISFYGWRFAFFIFCLLVMIIPLPLNAIFLKHRPEEMGLSPDDDLFNSPQDVNHRKTKSDEIFSPSLSHKEWTLGEALKTGQFWALLFFPFFTAFGIYVILVHHVKYLVDLGVDKIWAASLFAATGTISSGFRFFWGWFSDRIGREITFTIGGFCFSSGILLLLLFQYIPSFIFLYLFVLFFGAGWGVTAPMFMSVSADLYQGKNFGLIYGLVEGMVGIGAALGAWVAGFIFDQTQNYFWAFVLSILLNLLSVLFIWLAAPRKMRRTRSFSK